MGKRKFGCKSYSFVPRPGARGTRDALGRHSGGSRGHSGGSSPNALRVPPECSPTAPRVLLEGLPERPESPPSAPRVHHSTSLKSLSARTGCLRLTVARLRPRVTGAMQTTGSASTAAADLYGWYWTRACASSLMCCSGVWVCVRVPGRGGKYVRTFCTGCVRHLRTHVMAYVRTHVRRLAYRRLNVRGPASKRVTTSQSARGSETYVCTCVSCSMFSCDGAPAPAHVCQERPPRRLERRRDLLRAVRTGAV